MAIISLLTVASLTLGSYLLFDSNHKDLLMDKAFQSWKMLHGKSYSADENVHRLAVFSQNMKTVMAHNIKYEQGIESYMMEMNMFADLTTEEFAEKYLLKNLPFMNTGKCGGSVPDATVKQEWDWSVKGAVTAVKNQGQCGSCWAFSTTGALQGLNFLKNGQLESFSEQQLVDCSKDYGNMGCNGGLMNQSMWYVKDHGITTQAKYPYRGVGGACKYDSSMEAFRNTDCAEVTVDSEKALLTAITNGPVSVAIQANQIGFQLYKKGVFSGNCGTNLDHGVLAVGYGTMDGKPFYKVKNSWGGSWGSSGYIMMVRKGDGKGQCGIQMAATLPL